MSDDDHTPAQRPGRRGPIPFVSPRRSRRRGGSSRSGRPRVKKWRLFFILVFLGALAGVSTVFGMMMAVASDLPQIENRAEYRHQEHNSYLYDDHWRPIGLFAPPNNEVIDDFQQLGPYMRRAIVSVEDKRFWTDPGVDIKGIARAFVADLSGSARQGASTIAQQFVKNALSQEDNRTIFEKLREAALAYHLTREWPRAKILREYLNSIYFGNGAYGAESAARVYFGYNHGYSANPTPGSNGCGDAPRRSCASELTPPEAALLAGMVANPSAFNPIAFPHAAFLRRDLVLQDMAAQHYITRAQYQQYRSAPLPNAQTIEQPQEPPAAPYFTSWLGPQILHAMGMGNGVSAKVAEYRAYYGGLKIRTTIDLPMQQAAEAAISQNLPSGPDAPSASLVAIDNKTGQVRAMVGGPLINGKPDFNKYPFNLATEGLRQPGSSFKPFTLAVALEHGYGPSSEFDSKPLNIPDPIGHDRFVVRNFGGAYTGPTTLLQATAESDNSVFAQLGLSPGVGTRRIKRMAVNAGIRTPVSTNYSMILGGLKIGVSPLDMAHAYETFAEGGDRVYDPLLGAEHEGPTGIAQIQCYDVRCGGKKTLVDHPRYRRVMPPGVAADIHNFLLGVVTHGTGTNAAISGVDVVGKTGTTNNYGDAWFVGWTPQYTVAVWVGYPNKLIPMLHLYNGGPVEGGSFPALIWRQFMESALQIRTQEAAEFGPHPHHVTSTTSTTYSAPTGTAPPPASPSGTTPSSGGTTPAYPSGTTPAAPSGGGGTTPSGGGGTTPSGGGTGTTPAPSGGGTGGGGGGTGTGSSGGTGIGGG